MQKQVKRKVFQIHLFLITSVSVLIISSFLLIITLWKAKGTGDYLLSLYVWLGIVGFFFILYLPIAILSGTDYFDHTGMTRRIGKKLWFEVTWADVRLLKYRKWAGVIPICSIGVQKGTFTEEFLKKNIGILLFSSGVVLCMRKKKFQEIIDLIPEEFKQNMQIEV